MYTFIKTLIFFAKNLPFLKLDFGPSFLLFLIGQLLIWSTYIDKTSSDDPINSLQKLLDSGYVQLMLGVTAFPLISQYLGNHRKLAKTWIQLLCILILVLPVTQAVFCRRFNAHVWFSGASSVFVIGMIMVSLWKLKPSGRPRNNLWLNSNSVELAVGNSARNLQSPNNHKVKSG
jgi:cell division protein FtsW (lipid II flippase)